MTVRWSEPAAEDLQDMYDYIARDKPEAARSQIKRLIEAGDDLGQHPLTGRAGQVRGTRELVLTPFILIYRVREGIVEIDAVLHGSRRY